MGPKGSNILYKKGFNMGTRALRISELKSEKDIKEIAILFEEVDGKIASLKFTI